jgi:hypothetical protein
LGKRRDRLMGKCDEGILEGAILKEKLSSILVNFRIIRFES